MSSFPVSTFVHFLTKILPFIYIYFVILRITKNRPAFHLRTAFFYQYNSLFPLSQIESISSYFSSISGVTFSVCFSTTFLYTK